MSTLYFPAIQGRLIYLTNLTNRRLGVAGTVLGPGKTTAIAARRVYGHRTNMATMQALVQQGALKVTFEGDVLDQAEVGKIDAPLSGDLYVVRDIIAAPLAAVDNAVKTTWTAAAVDTTYATTYNADYARNVTITATTGAGEALTQKTFVVNGTDIDGHPLSEAILVAALGPSLSSVTLGVKAFKSVVSIDVPGDPSVPPGQYRMGFGDVFGLSHTLTQGVLLSESYDNGAPGGAGTVAFASASAPYGSYDPFDAVGPTHTWVIVYLPN